MSLLEKIEAERQSLADRRAKVAAQLTEIDEQLGDLVSAVKVVGRYAPELGDAQEVHISGFSPEHDGHFKAEPKRRGRRGRLAATNEAPKPPKGELAAASLRVVESHEQGATLESIGNALHSPGVDYRPNILGRVLNGHVKSGQLVKRDDRWYSPEFVPSSTGEHLEAAE